MQSSARSLTAGCVCRIFTASSASVVYLSFGSIPTDYAVLTFLVGLIFTLIGQVRILSSLRSGHYAQALPDLVVLSSKEGQR